MGAGAFMGAMGKMEFMPGDSLLCLRIEVVIAKTPSVP